MLEWKTLENKTLNAFWFKVGDFNINQKPKLMAIFSSNHSLDLYLPKSLGPCDFLPFFLINVFQKKSLLLREGLQKILYTDNTQPSHTCVMKEYLYYIMSLSQYHGCCQHHLSINIPWPHVYTMSHYLYHESMSTPRVHVYTMSPCVYHESLSIPCIYLYTMSPCQ